MSVSFVFVLGFPSGCHYFDQSNPLLCYISIWKEQGCLEEGSSYPSKLNGRDLQILDDKNLL